jgi:hypothetical protein
VEDSQLEVEVSKRVVHGTMQNIVHFLVFTIETGEDFEDGWLPTLDTSLKVDAKNIIHYRFYEKPTASKVCLQESTALGQNCKDAQHQRV